VFLSRSFRSREARPTTLATAVYLQSRGQQVEATRPNETIGFFVFFLAALRMWRHRRRLHVDSDVLIPTLGRGQRAFANYRLKPRPAANLPTLLRRGASGLQGQLRRARSADLIQRIEAASLAAGSERCSQHLSRLAE
jgi:hypothetical protein